MSTISRENPLSRETLQARRISQRLSIQSLSSSSFSQLSSPSPSSLSSAPAIATSTSSADISSNSHFLALSTSSLHNQDHPNNSVNSFHFDITPTATTTTYQTPTAPPLGDQTSKALKRNSLINNTNIKINTLSSTFDSNTTSNLRNEFTDSHNQSQSQNQATSPRTHSPPPNSYARSPLGTLLQSTFSAASSPPAAGSPKLFRFPSSSSAPSPNSTPSSTPRSTGFPPRYHHPSTTINNMGAGSVNHPSSVTTANDRHHTTRSAAGSTGGSDAVVINIGGVQRSQIVIPKDFRQSIMSNLGYIGLWFGFSSLLSIYNKNLMGKDQLGLNMPLFISSIHTGLHFIITACIMHFRENTGGRVDLQRYVTQVVPCAIAAALEICMANASLMYITLSFYTMIKSSTPIWVLMFAFAFGLEQPRPKLISIIFVIVIGVVLTVAGETEFDMTGFVLVLFASIMSGLRWSMTQILLQKADLGMDDPIATLYYISPIMFVLMSMLSLIIEDPIAQFGTSEFFDGFSTAMSTMLLASGGGLLAFAMTVSEFKLIKATSTVTLSVAGISKEIVIITLSILIFGDQLTLVNLLGLAVSIGGIAAYNFEKLQKHQKGEYEMVKRYAEDE